MRLIKKQGDTMDENEIKEPTETPKENKPGEILGQMSRNYKKAQKEIQELREQLETLKAENIAKEKTKTIKTLFLEQGGNDTAFADYFNKHKKELWEVEPAELVETIKTTAEITPWAFAPKINPTEKIDTQPKNINEADDGLVEGTIYKKRI